MKKLLFLIISITLFQICKAQDSLRLVLPMGHTDDVKSAYFSPDSKYVVTTGSQDKTARIWDVYSGKELKILNGFDGQIVNSCFSQDGNNLLVEAESENSLPYWVVFSVLSGTELPITDGHKKILTSATFSPDGKYLVTTSFDSTAILRELKSGRISHTMQGHTAMVKSATFTPDSKYLVTTSADSSAIIWDAHSGIKLHNLHGHKNLVRSASFSPNGKYLVTTSLDSSAIIWDFFSGKQLKQLRGHEDWVRSATFSPDGKYVLTTTLKDSNLDVITVSRIWNVKTGKELQNLRGVSKTGHITSFSPNGKYIVTASVNFNKNIDKLRICEVSTAKELHILVGHKNSFQSSCFSPDGKYVLTISRQYSLSEKNNVQIWEMATGNELHILLGHTDDVNSAIISPNGKFIVTSSDDCTARIWDMSSGKVVHILKGNTDYEAIDNFFIFKNKLFVAFSDSLNIRSLYTKYKIIVSDIINGKESISLNVNERSAVILFDSKSVSPDMKYWAMATDHSDTALIWDLISGNKLLSLKGHTKWIATASFSPDGDYIVTNSNDNTARIWEVSSGKQLQIYKGDTCCIEAFFSPNGKYLLSFSSPIRSITKENTALKLWDVASGKLMHILHGHTSYIKEATFSPNGIYLLTVSDDSTACLWDVNTGNILHRFKNNKGVIFASFSQDSKNVATVYSSKFSFEGDVCIWNVQSAKEIVCLRHTSPVNSAYFSPCGKYIASLAVDSILIWELSTAKKLYSIPIHQAQYEVFTGRDNFKFSPDYKYLLTLENGNEFIFWDLFTSKEIYSRYYFQKNNYLVKLPNSPYYMCSKDASKMLHYVTPSLKVIGFDQLDPIYNRPDIVLDSIGKYFAGGPDLQLIQQYKDAWVKRMNRLGLDTTTSGNAIEVPDAEIVNADNIEYNNTSGILNFRFKASDSKHNLRRYNIYVNEVPVYGSNGVTISDKVNSFEKDISLNLTKGDNKIQVSVMNDLGLESFRYPVYVQYQPAKDLVSNTYYIGIGVDSFVNSTFNLEYCVKDVNDLGSLLAKDKNTKSVTLKNKDVTKENVLKLKELLQKTTEQDKVIISCSSHGLLDKKNNFYLAMNDVDFNHPEINGLAYEDLQGLLDGIPARRKLLLLDACNSGENEKTENIALSNTKDRVIKEGSKGLEGESVSDSSENSFQTMMELFVNVNNQTGATVISAAGGKQSALEGKAVIVNGKPIRNGAFTYSIIEYLTQNKNGEKKLTVNELKKYAEQRVTEITDGKQKPTSRQETMEVDWEFFAN